jgi:hypothetical protein
MRKDLVRWQWDGYPTFHQRPVTLLIHLAAVPGFVASTLSLVVAVASLHVLGALGALFSMVVCFLAQGIAHKREPNPAIPFDGPVDVVTRIFLEQFFTFPRFVLSGGWWRAWKAAKAS